MRVMSGFLAGGRPAADPRRGLRGRGAAVASALFALLVALAALAPRSAFATVFTRFDFETPGFGTPPRRLSDHCYLKANGVWHLFYAELTHAGATNHIGHAVSTDLIHWTEHPTALVPGAQPFMAAEV